MRAGEKALCPRCDYLLTAVKPDVERRIFAFSLTSLLFLLFASVFPFLGFSAKGQERVVSLGQSVSILADEGSTLLAIVVLLSIVAIPSLALICASYVSASLISDRLFPATHRVLRFLLLMLPWSMAEIFLIGILISYIKISAMADVAFGLSFWSYVLFSVSMTAMVLHIDKRQLWTLIAAKVDHGH